MLGGAVNKLTYQTPVEDPGMEPGSTGQTGFTGFFSLSQSSPQINRSQRDLTGQAEGTEIVIEPLRREEGVLLVLFDPERETSGS